MSDKKSMTPRVYEAIAKSLREFGYPDCTDAMIQDTHAAQLSRAGGIDVEIPHGVIGMFAGKQLDEARDRGMID